MMREKRGKEETREEKYVTGCPFVSRCCLLFAAESFLLARYLVESRGGSSSHLP